MGYIPLGMAFGLLASSLLIPWYYAFLMSAFIFAGAGQFLALGLFATSATIVEVAVATFLLNMRHFFYSLSLIDTLKSMGVAREYVIFGLTDETFALLKTAKIDKDRKSVV